MKKILFTLIVVLVSLSPNFGQSKADLIITDEKFSPSGKVETFQIGAGKDSKKETGVINGVAYSVYYDKGTGNFVGKKGGKLGFTEYKDNWMVSCQKDSIDDKKTCFMNKGDLTILIDSEKDYAITVGKKHDYDSSIAIRIDNNEAFQKRGKYLFTNQESQKIIEQLKSGKSITTRFSPEFADARKDDNFELYGFNEAFQYLNWAFSKIK